LIATPSARTLDTSGSTVAVGWSATAVELTPGATTTERWATVSPVARTIGAGQTATPRVTPASALCTQFGTGGTFTGQVNVQLVAGGSGTVTFTDTVQGIKLT
jgi:hypothetical protein